MKYKNLNIRLLGTNIKIRILHNDPDIILDKCKQMLEDYNERFSIYNQDSELMNINSSAGHNEVKVKDDLFDLIKMGIAHSKSNDNLNISIGPLVKLWNIGFEDAIVPNKEDIKQKLKVTDINKIKINTDENSIFLEKEGMEIDLGALAKGYIADRIKEYLISEDVLSALIDLGGNIVTIGLNLDSHDLNWKIGLQDPQDTRGNHLMTLELNDLSIVTSGIYERKLSVESTDYHHIISPKTGYPVDSDMLSLSIISERSVVGEIWTSRLFGMDFSYIEETCQKEANIEAIAVYKGNIIRHTDKVNKFVIWRKK